MSDADPTPTPALPETAPAAAAQMPVWNFSAPSGPLVTPVQEHAAPAPAEPVVQTAASSPSSSSIVAARGPRVTSTTMDARSPYGLGVFLYAVTWLAFITIFVNAVLSFFPYFPHKELVMIAGAFAGAWVPFAALYLKLLGTRFGRNNKWLSAYIASPIVAVASTAFTLIGMWLLFAEAHLAGMAYCIYIPFFIWFLISGRAYLEDTVPYTTPSDDDRFAAAIPTASKVLFIIAIVVFVISLAAGALANVQLAAGIATAVAGGDAASVLKGAGIAGAIGSLQLLVPLILAWRGALPQIGLRSTGRRWLTVTVRIVGTLLVLAFPFVVPAIIAAQYMQLAGH